MVSTWLAGGAFTAPAGAKRTAGVWHSPGLRVRAMTAGAVGVVVAGVCRADDTEVTRTAVAVASGRPEAITGMSGAYWMAVHDSERGRTVVAGDFAEIRGVFTARTDRGPVWATNAAMLAAQLGRGPDLELLTARITVGSAEHWPDRSMWSGIERVPGGHALVLDEAGTRTVDIRPRPDGRSLEAGAEEVGAALWAATQGYAHAAGPRVSADLSGGLDSSTVVIAASAVRPVMAVTYGGPLADSTDTRLARHVAAYVGAEHRVSSGGKGTAHFSRWPRSHPHSPVLPVSSYPLDADYLPPARGFSTVHLTGHGGDVVLESSTAAWTALAQDGQTRRARAAVTALARRVNTAPGPLWRVVREEARGRPPALYRASEAVAQGRLLGQGLGVWTWCPIGPATRWLTPTGREAVAGMLKHSGRAVGHVDAGEWDDWSALRYNGSAMRDSEPLFEEHGVHQVSPFLDNEVVRACLRIGAGERRRPDRYKPLLALSRPDLPGWLTGRQSKGHFTPLLYEGLGARCRELHRVIDASELVNRELIDPAAVHTALDEAVAGVGRPPLPALESFLITSWWLGRTMAPARGEGTE
ncbi:asparagine synthetase B family protein [Streptomyces bauhiniae]|uniref:Asparagine synthetase B family protein n=1 Tax=Streptomyces bauhiniae TaxID=2340725 RepID=A0A4Z1CXJ5_9ACTN|nr:asparagine synthase-related protein [Streptomyces bauhiniae]TGN73910.1 asparagine synthetase B family protein [Streptomyces bauhiniae]